MPMSESQANAVSIAERVASVFSVLGAFFIIGTFTFDRRFRKPINRLVFYASWGNLFANVATLISRSGIRLGVDAPLCQFQAFLIQWCMPADALWTFAMACNVYLTFFRQYDAASLRKLEWRYLAICYGLPFIPAFVYCFIETAERGKFYGSANLWCWVRPEWNVFRIATFYGPVWVIVLTNMVIYIKVGAVVLKWRRQLVSLNRAPSTDPGRRSAPPLVSVPMGSLRSPATQKGYEVSIVSQVPHRAQAGNNHYSLTSPTIPAPGHTRFPSSHTMTDEQHGSHRRTTIVHPVSITGTHRVVDANRATMSYCYTALLFFIALLVTWVPSTINRLYTLILPHSSSPFGLDLSSALVLPLQGFWNTVIYIVTSFAACKALVSDLRDEATLRSNSDAHPEKYGLPPQMRRHATHLGSLDTTDREINAHSQFKAEDDSRSSYTLTEIVNKADRRSKDNRSSSGEPSQKADIVISFDGKKRVIVHNESRSGAMEETFNPFNTPEKKEKKPRSRPWEDLPEEDEGEEEESQTRLYGSARGNRTSMHDDSSSEDADTNMEIDIEKLNERRRTDFRVGLAR